MAEKVKQAGVVKRLWSQAKIRLLFCATFASLVFGATEFGEPLDKALLLLRNVARQHDTSGDIVLVAIDDRSLEQLQERPWPRRYYGQLADRLREGGVRRVFFDLDLTARTKASEDAALAQALKRLDGKGALTLRFVIDPITGRRTDKFPETPFRRTSRLVIANVPYTSAGITWEIPYSLNYGGKGYPSLASALAETSGAAEAMFPVDYALNPRSVRVISAADVISGAVSADTIRNKDVVVAATSTQLGEMYLMPGYGRMPGIYVHILGAETLKAGHPIPLGWLVPLLFTLALAVAAIFRSRLRYSIALFSAGTAALLLLPLLLERSGVFMEVVPALFLLFAAAAAHSWQTFRRSYSERSRINAISGLPNLNALREQGVASDQILIAARVQNYAEISATLPVQDERVLVEQIASRLTVGTSATTLYQGDEGIFAWLAGAELEPHLDEHLNALHALFRSPVAVAEHRFDLSLTFGVDTGSDRSAANRLGGALVAADEAAHDSLRWKRYDPADPEDAAWKLSILSQLDAAIEAGDLWVAYQPKFDLSSRTMVGAEALVRWSHPEKGPISPMEFVPAAEQNGRIETLTEFVLERAIRAAALINRRGLDFNMSVNLSPKLLGRFPLEATVVDLLNRHGLKPEHLTLEVTETAALATGVGDLGALHSLRGRGVHISIDDYGTGLSTLDYVKRIPATEIKVDKSFVQSIGKSVSDKLMVNSTIQLAHSLGQKVVAEGVEDAVTLEALASMGCDLVQGYYIAKPMTFKDMVHRLLQEKERRAA